MYYSKMERLNIVLDIVNKLKNFETTQKTIINLYDENMCSFISNLKIIFDSYVKQDETKLTDYKGELLFEEINKNIIYYLPVKKKDKPLFVIKGKENKH